MKNQQKFGHCNCRFDVIGIHPIDGKINIEWIKDAFSVEN